MTTRTPRPDPPSGLYSEPPATFTAGGGTIALLLPAPSTTRSGQTSPTYAEHYDCHALAASYPNSPGLSLPRVAQLSHGTVDPGSSWLASGKYSLDSDADRIPLNLWCISHQSQEPSIVRQGFKQRRYHPASAAQTVAEGRPDVRNCDENCSMNHCQGILTASPS